MLSGWRQRTFVREIKSMRHFLLVCAVCLYFISVPGCPLGVGPVNVTVSNYEKIQVGMTMQDVEQLLGRPGHVMDRRAAPEKDPNIPVEANWRQWRRERSSQPNQYIAVAFIDDKVVAKELVGIK